MAFFGYDLEEEEEGEFKLGLGGGGVVVLQMFGHWAQNSLLSLPLWLPFQIRPLKNGPSQLLPLLPE